jgi:DNA-directed RNA polymerase subunit RPC12/RpoP
MTYSREALTDAKAYTLHHYGQCPDCGSDTMRGGPKGGMSQNVACANCGAEFNDMVFRVERNSPKDQPNRERLREVYGITLADPEPPQPRSRLDLLIAAYRHLLSHLRGSTRQA